MKRSNLTHEAKMIGNMYRDLIRSYGIDCTYYKLNTNKNNEFKNIIDENTILRYAYGYDHDPDYTISSQMLTYMEVESDIFQLNKYGINPNMDVNFYFDSTDFACSLATKLGQYKEYKIEEHEIVCEVPKFDPKTSAEVFPYKLGLGYNETVKCDLLSGKLSAQIDEYEVGKEHNIVCNMYEHTDFKIDFPVNEYIHKSFKYKIQTDDFIDSAIFLKYHVDEIASDKGEVKYILSGKIYGAILFYDLNKIGKYQRMIFPEVGDLVTIDFPDQDSKEQYEIVEAYDKTLTQDGLNPLLHKYIWKCKARRYVNSYEAMENNEDNNELEEQLRFDNAIQQSIVDKISIYDNKQDAAYGGYEAQQMNYDSRKFHEKTDIKRHEFEYLDPNTGLDLLRFECGSKLVTTGYELFFVKANGDVIKLASQEFKELSEGHKLFEQDLQQIKASDSMIVFTDLNGRTFKLAGDDDVSATEITLCLNSLADRTFQTTNPNNDLDNFYKFTNTKSFLFATDEDLYYKLASNGKMYRLT